VLTPPPIASSPPRATVLAPPPVVRKAPSRKVVVIDAGHGGPDNGMTGPIGTPAWFVEKDVVLSVAKKLSTILRARGVDVLMTRTTDTLIALSDRGRIANSNRGDVFISIHVNAPGSRTAAGARERGFETYFLAEAKTEDSRRVQDMENESVKFETGANAPKGDPLSFIITDMAQNEHLRESSDLAQTIQQGLIDVHPGPNRGVNQANFAVLRGSYMPAVLVELGFGSNQSEATYLSDQDNQRALARNIAESVIAYLANYESRIGGTR
jgi:N-acetylmuramoyl-L-alanine amidase